MLYNSSIEHSNIVILYEVTPLLSLLPENPILAIDFLTLFPIIIIFNQQRIQNRLYAKKETDHDRVLFYNKLVS